MYIRRNVDVSPRVADYARTVSEPNPEWLILAITLIALAMAPLASKLVRDVGDRVSGESGGGAPTDEAAERRARDEEIGQMLEARAYIRARRGEQDGTAQDAVAPPATDDGLREEVRQVVVAGNERRARMGEPPLDVEAEVERRLARLLGGADAG